MSTHPLLIVEPRRSLVIRDMLLTVLAWLLFGYLFWRGVIFTLESEPTVGPRPLAAVFLHDLTLISFYVLVCLFNGAVLILWAKYNQFRGRVEKRRRRDDLSPEELSRSFHVPLETLSMLPMFQVVTIHNDARGGFAFAEVGNRLHRMAAPDEAAGALAAAPLVVGVSGMPPSVAASAVTPDPALAATASVPPVAASAAALAPSSDSEAPVPASAGAGAAVTAVGPPPVAPARAGTEAVPPRILPSGALPPGVLPPEMPGSGRGSPEPRGGAGIRGAEPPAEAILLSAPRAGPPPVPRSPPGAAPHPEPLLPSASRVDMIGPVVAPVGGAAGSEAFSGPPVFPPDSMIGPVVPPELPPGAVPGVPEVPPVPSGAPAGTSEAGAGRGAASDPSSRGLQGPIGKRRSNDPSSGSGSEGSGGAPAPPPG
ncbi:poly-beta-1,6-N-acetyl-D-glucosamine biosynthesis protein PgaD [Phaeovibrio sulfidiphilus]|uniref:Poly-beta-1,6-N-acetyl-D-glucosamine biosynthesis protein PgaD n=1 Tax=Phaeovibrio sulfidiphilus TaxID=1220600 RepID=A0A8J6YLZ1_9PROT|nr:poly-beta-1,6-N-acetyl-D-glucosamine biosynthesis protein PgaD [Phaeovibrio sulfidiphilus]MBE1236860.1 poly-beta-1,6-N-acetyl-D-glucosamine biosynthesis protein PgaD [Phaeovibrio sulfidiphilus]